MSYVPGIVRDLFANRFALLWKVCTDIYDHDFVYPNEQKARLMKSKHEKRYDHMRNIA